MAVAAGPRPLDALVAADALAVRRTLRAQVARLDAQLAAHVWDGPLATAPAAGAGPRLQSVADLERHRDALVARLGAARRRAAGRAERENQARLRLEAILAAPERHRFVRVTRAELGLPGCGAYAVRPRLGIVGMLAGWWEVKLSSGCPLATCRGISLVEQNGRAGCWRGRWVGWVGGAVVGASGVCQRVRMASVSRL